MGSRTPSHNSMGSVEPMESMLTQPLQTAIINKYALRFASINAYSAQVTGQPDNVINQSIEF